MRYEGTLRRRGRQLRRFAEAVSVPESRHSGIIVPTF